MLTETIVEVTVASKKQTPNYDPKKPIAHEIELHVPYDQNSIFYQMSGGTVMKLNTTNQDAADMFELGGKYVMSIKPKPADIPAEETTTEETAK